MAHSTTQILSKKSNRLIIDFHRSSSNESLGLLYIRKVQLVQINNGKYFKNGTFSYEIESNISPISDGSKTGTEIGWELESASLYKAVLSASSTNTSV